MGKKSKYAKKMKRKTGNGPIDPRWMWWTQDPNAAPRRVR